MIHSTAVIGDRVTLGAETTVWQFATVCNDTKIGARSVIGSAAWIGANVRAGYDVHIQHGAFVPNGTVLGNRVFIGPCAVLTDDKHPVVNNRLYRAEPPVIESDANIGAGAVICPGVRVGRGATVGAGAVVTRDVQPHVVVVGVPAKEVDRGLDRTTQED